MRLKQLAAAAAQTPLENRRQDKYYPFIGAVDIVTPELQKNPGSAAQAINYEPGLNGGFRLMDGYESFDGRAAPSAALWYTLELTDLTGITLGATITGAGGGSGVVVVIDTTDSKVAITAFNGTDFVAAETTNFTGDVVAVQALGGSLTGTVDNAIELAAQDYYRDLIAAMTGSGDCLGVWRHLDTVYAFRNNAGGTLAILYKATASGWAVVELFYLLYFDAGTAAFVYNETFTASGGAAGTVKKIIKTSGKWEDGDAAGYFMLDLASGTIANDETITGGTAGVATSVGVESLITLQPGGRYEFESFNFFAGSSTYYTYGCDGVNNAFEIDTNDIYTPIFTTATTDTPKYLKCHKKHLFLSIEGTMFQSRVGWPFIFDGEQGAGEHSVGANITGMKVSPGNVLNIATLSTTHALYGNTIDDFQLDTISSNAGALDYTYITLFDSNYGLENLGVKSDKRVQAFGNFEAATVTRAVQPLIDSRKLLVTGVCVLRKRNQLRFFFSDNSVLVIGFFLTDGGGFQARCTTFQLDHAATCVVNCEGANGEEHIYFGASDGKVYEMEKGFSFDGGAMERFLRTNFNPVTNSILQQIHFYGVIPQIKATSNFTMQFSYELSFGDPNKAPTGASNRSRDVYAGGGYWDDDNYDEMYYDLAEVTPIKFPCSGDGSSISIAFHGDDAITKSHTIEGYTLDFSPRGRQRAYHV